MLSRLCHSVDDAVVGQGNCTEGDSIVPPSARLFRSRNPRRARVCFSSTTAEKLCEFSVVSKCALWEREGAYISDDCRDNCCSNRRLTLSGSMSLISGRILSKTAPTRISRCVRALRSLTRLRACASSNRCFACSNSALTDVLLISFPPDWLIIIFVFLLIVLPR